MRSVLAAALALLLLGCPAAGTADAGVPPVPDSGPVLGPACDSPEDCTVEGFDGVCRQGRCQAEVPCEADNECGLGELCAGTVCRFSGCIQDSDCATGSCRKDAFACAECGAPTDCPPDRPVCASGSRTCVQCSSDAQCPVPGPGRCDLASGACVHCLTSADCPNGLTCGAQGACVGAPEGASCSAGVVCDVGNLCLGNGRCARRCNVYANDCDSPRLCFAASLVDSTSRLFDDGVLVGVCIDPQAGFKGLREPCVRNSTGGNCQGNLQCIPESSSGAVCRNYCDPNAPLCGPGDTCQPFKGDFQGRRYGLCYPDNGFGTPCSNDTQCRAGQACAPWDDPSQFGELSPLCQFKVGNGAALAACANGTSADGGAVPASRTCASGACVADPALGGSPFFCYAACAKDTDCSSDGGVCTDFDFPNSQGTLGSVKGCRPQCSGDGDCAARYGAANGTCRLQLLSGFSARLNATCGPSRAPLQAGAACSQSSQCASGYCLQQDSRGVARPGTCAAVCATASDCTSAALPDGGVDSPAGPLGCGATSLLLWAGFDGQPGTADDRVRAATACRGLDCTDDSACGAGRCTLQRAAENASTLVQQCAPPTRGVGLAGQVCSVDSQCESGTCGALVPPSVGNGGRCFQACTASTVCPAGTTCRASGMTVTVGGASVRVDSCAP